MCRRFTGPHSVLQVFLEKIISSISQIAETHRFYSEKTLCLWNEEKVSIDVTPNTSNLDPKNKNQTGETTSLLITKKSCLTQESTKPLEEQQFEIVLTPKPLLENIEIYN